MAATAGYDKPAQGHPRRIDRFYLSAELTPAIYGVRVGDRDELGHLSDHLPVVLDLDATELFRIMNRDPSLLAP